MPLLEAARETARELEEARKTIEDLKKEKAELVSAADATKRKLDARNLLLTETLDVVEEGLAAGTTEEKAHELMDNFRG